MNLEAHPELPSIAIPLRDDSHKIKRLPCCLYLEDENGKTLIKLNDSSSLIWSLCTGEHNVGEIIGLLEESYPDAKGVIAKDVNRVLDEFVNEKIISLDAA
jgi:hypothetical protein